MPILMGPLFFLLIIFPIASFKLSYSINFCPEIEKKSLISFKQSLEDPSNKLSSWNVNGEVNCCKWKGVVCNNYTGHVHQLRLQKYNLRGELNPSLLNLKQLRYLDLSENDFGQTFPSFVGSFPSLEYLDLFDAGFYGTIPHSIGNLSNLRALNLFSTPRQRLDVDSLEWLSGLSQLEHLDMSYVDMSRVGANWTQVINTLSSLVELRFRYCSLDFFDPLNDVVNVSSLAILDLSNNNFHSFVIPKWIFQLSELTSLDLSISGFEGPIPSSSNTTKLQYIDLYYNRLNSTIPNWLYFCKDLEFVDLRINSLRGSISNAIANLSSLNTLYLYSNKLSGKIPREIANLCRMKELDLSSNMFEGEISYSFGNMSDCFLGTLKDLGLGGNQLSGHLPNQFGEFRRLQLLDVANNKLNGNLPKSLGQLSNIVDLYIEDNMLQGVVSESHFANMTQLNTLNAGGNNLTLKVNPNWIPPFKLSRLSLRSWNLGNHFPSWLKTQKNIDTFLDLSCTGISGQVPSWFWNFSDQVLIWNLSHNHLHGEIPRIGGYQIYLNSNQFSGSLPRVANLTAVLDLSYNSFSGGTSHFFCDGTSETYSMTILNLGENHISGELPDCWQKWAALKVLNLGYNNMFGSIPNSIGFLVDLMFLNLPNNKFSGQIPFLIHNFTELVKMDLSNNELDGKLPAWIGTSLRSLQILILRSNKLSDEVSSKICHLKSLQILDLSDNHLSGMIPRCVDNFTAMATKRSLAKYGNREMDYSVRWPAESFTGSMQFEDSAIVSMKGREFKYDTILSLINVIDLSNNNLSGEIPKELTRLVELQTLNLSGNHLIGLIPDRIGEMKQLESLDLSRNSLCGEIPNSLTGMSFLSHLNLSYNNLTGRIPESAQIRGFNSSSFVGNKLCGPPLMTNCNVDGFPHAPLNKEDNEGNRSEIDWFYILLSLGYAAGFSIVCTTLIFKKSWREAYFELLEDLWNKVYVYIYIKWRRFAEQRVGVH